MGIKAVLTSSLLRILDRYIISSFLQHPNSPGMVKMLLT